MWRILSNEPEFTDKNGSGVSAPIRNHSSYKRFNRDHFVLECHRQGLSNREIAEKSRTVLGEYLKENNIAYIINTKKDIL